MVFFSPSFISMICGLLLYVIIWQFFTPPFLAVARERIYRIASHRTERARLIIAKFTAFFPTECQTSAESCVCVLIVLKKRYDFHVTY